MFTVHVGSWKLKRLVSAFLIMGASCAISQVLLVREFMIIFSGDELTLGIIFVNWLLCVAIGSWGLGRIAEGLTENIEWFIITQILSAVILPVQILLTRTVGGWIGGGRGEIVGLLPTFYSTFLVLFPFCSLHGFQFTLGSKLLSKKFDTSSIQIGKTYVFESLGSMIGGLVFTYLLVHYLHVLEIAVFLGMLNLSQALFLQITEKRGGGTGFGGRILTGIIVILLTINAFAIVSGKVSELHAASYRWQYKEMDLLHYENSIYGNIVITQSDGQLDFWVNGLPLFTSPDPDMAFVEEVTHFPMLQHPSPEKVLLIGGGVGGVLDEILKHPVREVYYIELDPLTIDLARKYSPIAPALLDDPRVRVIHVDGRLFVKRTEDSFDVIIVNLPAPSTLQLNRFYTLEFFKEIHKILNEDGVFSIGLSSSLGHVPEEMRDRNKCIYETIREVFPSYLVVPGYYNLFLASPSTKGDALTYNAGTLFQRLLNRGIKTSLFTEGYIQYKFSPDMLERGLAYLYENREEINRDLRPVGVYYDLVLWNAMFYPHSRRFFGFISRINLWWFIIPLGLLIWAFMKLRKRLKSPSIPVYTTIMTTGFAGMTFNIVLTFGFQALCGYLYQELAMVSATFMLGLAVGGLCMSQAIPRLRKGVSTLAKVEFAIIAYSFTLPLVITLLFSVSELFMFQWIRLLLPLLNCAAGFLVGLEFPLASEICLKDSGRVGRVAGALYASDLLGGCAGALLSSIWLIPLLGVLRTCLVVAVFNAASLLLLIMSGR